VARAHKIIDSQAIASAQPTGARAKRLALFFFNENVLMAETGRGFLEEVEHAGLKRRYNLQIDEKNAQNDYAIAQSIAQDIVRQHYDYLVTFSTPALQIAAQFNKAIPHVFGAVTDPFSMGIAKTPADHLPQITGVATLQPVEKTLQLIRTVFPKARRIGMVWNPGEACSEVCVGKAKASAGENGFEIVDATVSGTSEVLDAVRAVLDRKVDVFFTSGDNTVGLAKPTIAKLLAGRRVPYVTNDPSDVGRGAFLALGADYTEVGRETARVLARVLAGEKPRDIPIAAFLPETLAINNERARDWGIVLPVEVAKRVASAQRPRS
jgi:putative ABC transport system permease protein